MSLPQDQSPAGSNTEGSTSVELPRISPWVYGWFTRYAFRYARKHFNSVRVTKHSHTPDQYTDTPLLIYLNHPSWWDPMICIIAARTWINQLNHYAPIDAAAVEKYAFMKKIGFLPLAQHEASSVRNFMRTSRTVLSEPGRALWITAQGEFADPRLRPITLQPGLSRIIHRLNTKVKILPMAIEYTHWQEKLPEALMHFGSPVDYEGQSRENLESLLPQRLEQSMNELQTCSVQRDENAFNTLITGKSGIGWVYDQWRRLKAATRGQSFDPHHQSANSGESS